MNSKNKARETISAIEFYIIWRAKREQTRCNIKFYDR